MKKYRCSVCHQYKAQKGFYSDSSNHRGIGSRCIECDAIYRKDAGSKRGKYFRDYSLLNKEKIQAKWKSDEALKVGKIKRQPCELCGVRAEKHHDNYSEPLKVRWLCRRHHMQHHNGAKDNIPPSEIGRKYHERFKSI